MNPHVPMTQHQQFLIYGQSCSPVPVPLTQPHCFDVNCSYSISSAENISGENKDVFIKQIAYIKITQEFVGMQVLSPKQTN